VPLSNLSLATECDSRSVPRMEPTELWTTLRDEAGAVARREPLLARYLDAVVLSHGGFASALGALLGIRLADAHMPIDALAELVAEAVADDPAIAAAAAADLVAGLERNPAAGTLATPFLYFKGFHGLESYRVAHWLWRHGRHELALWLQSRISEAFGVDIHPAARIGRGVFVDHATGLVIGETAVVGDDVSMLQEVTLGGTGKHSGDRHPKVRNGVLIGAGAKILGNIIVGTCAKIGAGSVVLRDVPPFCTVAGVPAHVVARRGRPLPSLSMDHSLPDEG
jgi:serine O-acetyltransferase